jgi:hypothetical protein
MSSATNMELRVCKYATILKFKLSSFLSGRFSFYENKLLYFKFSDYQKFTCTGSQLLYCESAETGEIYRWKTLQCSSNFNYMILRYNYVSQGSVYTVTHRFYRGLMHVVFVVDDNYCGLSDLSSHVTYVRVKELVCQRIRGNERRTLKNMYLTLVESEKLTMLKSDTI